jgi:hypothetical protein
MMRLLIDENFDHRILRGLKIRHPGLDYVVVQATSLKGVSDPELLEAAAEQNLVLVTHDVSTIPRYAYERIKAAQIMPGVIVIPEDLPVGQAIDEMSLVIECCAENELENVILYIPV